MSAPLAYAAQRGGRWGVLVSVEGREALFVAGADADRLLAQMAQALDVARGLHPAQAQLQERGA